MDAPEIQGYDAAEVIQGDAWSPKELAIRASLATPDHPEILRENQVGKDRRFMILQIVEGDRKLDRDREYIRDPQAQEGESIQGQLGVNIHDSRPGSGSSNDQSTRAT